MAKGKTPFAELIPYIPEGSFEPVMEFIYHYKVQLTLTRERKTILGNYRHPFDGKGHRISINANLNKYSFLITLLHELAHLFAWEKYRNKVPAHGKEWKKEFSQILSAFVEKKIFPADINKALAQSLKNPAASSCGDEQLLRVLKKYDKLTDGTVFVEELAGGELFSLPDGRIFEKGDKLRKRIKCKEIHSGKYYLFSPVYEVKRSPEN